MIDSSELAKAQAQIQSLMKENDLLKVGITQAEASATIVSGAAALEQLRQATGGSESKTGSTNGARGQTGGGKSIVANESSIVAGERQRRRGVARGKSIVKKQLADLRSAMTNSSSTADLNSELARLREHLATLQSDAEVNWLEKAALENRLQRFQSTTPSPASGAQVRELTGEVKTLRARLAVDEAQAVPYTPEELALFKQSEPQLVASPETNRSTDELPADTVTLVAEAQRDFSARQFDKAEDALSENFTAR